MREYHQHFATRREELETYFTFVTTFLPTEQDNLYKILRANCFLILYNLIESTIHIAIQTLYDEINTQQLSYESVDKHIQTLFIKQKTIKFSKSEMKQENITKAVKEIIDDAVVRHASINLGTELVDYAIQGNINFKLIEKIKHDHKLFGSIQEQRLKHITLEGAFEIIKDNRNALAHGRESFLEVGRNSPIEDILIYKELILSYLSDFLAHVEIYLENEKYRPI